MVDYSMTVLLTPFSFREDYGSRSVRVGSAELPEKKQHKGVITGRVYKKDIPVVRRVFCYERSTSQLVGSTVSNENGDYEFHNLPLNKFYYLVTIEKNNDGIQFNAVIQDLIQPTIAI